MNSSRMVTEALNAFVRSDIFEKYNNSLILKPKFEFDFLPPSTFNGVAWYLYDRHDEETKKPINDSLRHFELNPPTIFKDQLVFKVDHCLEVNLKAPISISQLKGSLTDTEKDVIVNLLAKDIQNEKSESIKSRGMALFCEWSFVYFKFAHSENQFEFEKTHLETQGYSQL